MIPTRRFWLLVAVGIPIAAVSATFGAPTIVVAYDALLVLAAYGSTFFATPASELRIRRKFDAVLSVRAANKIVLLVENDGSQTIVGRLRDEPPARFEASDSEFGLNLAPGDLVEFGYSVSPQERGTTEFRGTFLRQVCPFGLAYRDIFMGNEQSVRVYPNVLALREFDLLNQKGRLREMGIRRSRSRGLGTEFESLRDYAEGDDYRKIDWKASARRGRHVVRQYEQERNQAIILCIDVGRYMLSEVDRVTKLDHVLDALLMITHAAAAAGDMVGLLVYAERVRRYIPPRKGRSQVGLIIEAVHDLIAEPVESDPVLAFGYLSSRWTRRALVVNFTDFDNEDRARMLATALAPMARKHLTLVVRVQDPKLDELLMLPVTDRAAMYQNAAATLLLEGLMSATAILSASRIHLLQSEPQDLAARLVSYYLQVKEQSRL